MVLTIPYASSRKRNMAPMPAWGRDERGEVWIRCACGLPVTLDVPATHTIAADGSVSPSVWHDDCPAGWHTFVRLGEWERQEILSYYNEPREYYGD